MTTLTSPRTLLGVLGLVLLADLTGAVVAIATGLHGVGTTIASGTPINAPVPFIVVQTLLAFGAVRARGRLTAVPCALLAFLCFVSVASGFGDGSYATDLSPGERAIQAAIVAPTAVLCVTAALRGVRAMRRRPIAA